VHCSDCIHLQHIQAAICDLITTIQAPDTTFERFSFCQTRQLQLLRSYYNTTFEMAGCKTKRLRRGEIKRAKFVFAWMIQLVAHIFRFPTCWFPRRSKHLVIMSGFASLPFEVLKIVMQHVPLKDRLTCCCFVNRKLLAAAVAATEELVLFLAVDGWQEKEYMYVRWTDVHQDDQTVIKFPQHADSFLHWLSQYGQQMTSLRLLGFPRPIQQLLCPNLLHLTLEECSVQLGPAADGSAGVMQGCTKLTRLELACSVIDTREGAVLDSLSCLVDLQDLSVRPRKDMVDYWMAGLSRATLPQLQHLSYLYFDRLSIENLLLLGGLTNLQGLQLSAPRDIFVGPSSVPGLVFPASLTELQVESPIEAGMLSAVPTGLQELFIDCELGGVAEGPGSLLHGMARLQHLTRLVVKSEHGLNWPPPGPAYSALMASSNLQDLYMYNTRPPAGVWPYVFPEARILPHLTKMCFFDCKYVGESDPPSAWGAADLPHLVRVCPNMCMISGIDLQHGPHVSELHELTALTYLGLYYDSSSLAAREETFKGLAALTQLEDLCISCGDEEPQVASLLPLTSLTALTRLWVSNGEFELKLELGEVCRLADAASPSNTGMQQLQHGTHTHVRPDVSMACLVFVSCITIGTHLKAPRSHTQTAVNARVAVVLI
jgi:hypothetical protein